MQNEVLSGNNENKIIFQLKDVYKQFGDNPETCIHALVNINFSIERGEFTSCVGPSGSGKSTLLNIMSGLDFASSGDVFLLKKSIKDFSGNDLANYRRDHIGFIFQSYNLIPVLSVMENVEYVMVLQGITKSERRIRVLEILEKVGLLGKENRRPFQLSGGQQQRVAVARAIVTNPDIILADEPTANLDSKTGEELVYLMKNLNETLKTTFIFSTHDPTIMKMANRLVTLKDGEIVSDQVRH